MRLTGSFQTIVTQGVSGTTSSSASGRSTSAGATLTGSSPPQPALQSPSSMLPLSPSMPVAWACSGTTLPLSVVFHYETPFQAARRCPRSGPPPPTTPVENRIQNLLGIAGHYGVSSAIL